MSDAEVLDIGEHTKKVETQRLKVMAFEAKAFIVVENENGEVINSGEVGVKRINEAEFGLTLRDLALRVARDVLKQQNGGGGDG